MSRGLGKTQRALMALFKDEANIRLNSFDMAKAVYKTPKPTRTHLSAINRALLSLEKPLVALGWDLGRGSITERDDQWCVNQRFATGRVNVLTHTERFHIALRARLGNKPVKQYLKDELPDGEKFIKDLEKEAALEVRMQIVMEVDQLLQKAPIKLKHLERLKSTLVKMHREDLGMDVSYEKPKFENSGSSAYDRAVMRSLYSKTG